MSTDPTDEFGGLSPSDTQTIDRRAVASLIEAARADERARCTKLLREAADEFIAAMPPGVSDERVRLSSIASAFRDEADDIEERLAKADPEPAPAPVEWVDGRAIVGEVSVQWDGGAHFDLHIQGDEEDGTRLTPSSQFDTHAAKRLAIAVARALAETGRTP